MTSSFTARSQTFLAAALLAAHVASDDQGLRPADVRFYFLLFTNWVEHDVLRPGQDIQLTQIRRELLRLVERDWTKVLRRGRRPRYRLTDEGLLGLAAAVVDPPERRSIEESLFAIGFCRLYRDAQSPPIRRALDPQRVLTHARRRTLDLLADLDARCADGRAMQEALDASPGGDDERLARLAEHGSYQLERIRPLAEVMPSLPSSIRQAELDRGPGTRVDLIFAPMAELLRAELATLDRVQRCL